MLPVRIIIKATTYYWEENRPVLLHMPLKSTNYSRKFEFMCQDSSCNQHRCWRGDRKIWKGSLDHLTSAYNCSKLWVWAWTVVLHLYLSRLWTWTVVSHLYLSKLWTWTVVSHLYLSKLCCCHCCSAELELCLKLSCPNIAACTQSLALAHLVCLQWQWCLCRTMTTAPKTSPMDMRWWLVWTATRGKWPAEWARRRSRIAARWSPSWGSTTSTISCQLGERACSLHYIGIWHVLCTELCGTGKT